MSQHKPQSNSNGNSSAAAAGAGVGGAGQPRQSLSQLVRPQIPLPQQVHRVWNDTLAVQVARDALKTVNGAWFSEAELMGEEQQEDDGAAAAAAPAPAAAAAGSSSALSLHRGGLFASSNNAQYFALFKASPAVRDLPESEQLAAWREAMSSALVDLSSNSSHANIVLHRPDGIKPMCVQYTRMQDGAGITVTHWRVVPFVQDQCRCGELSQRHTKQTDELNGLRPEVLKMLTKGYAPRTFYPLSELAAHFLETHTKIPAGSIPRVPQTRGAQSSVQLKAFGARAAADAAANPYYHGASLSTSLWLEELLAHDLQSHALLLEEGMRIELRWVPRLNGGAQAAAAEELQVSWIPVSEVAARASVQQAQVRIPAYAPSAPAVPSARPAAPRVPPPAAVPVSTKAICIVLKKRITERGVVYSHPVLKPSNMELDSDSDVPISSSAAVTRAQRSALHQPEAANLALKSDRPSRSVAVAKTASSSAGSSRSSKDRRWKRLVPPPGAPPLPVQLPKSDPGHKASVAEYNRIYGKYYRAPRDNKRRSNDGSAAAPQRDSDADELSEQSLSDDEEEDDDANMDDEEAADANHAGAGADVSQRVQRGVKKRADAESPAAHSKKSDSSEDSEFVSDEEMEDDDHAAATSHRKVRRKKTTKEEESDEEEEDSDDASDSEEEEDQSSDEDSDSKAAPRPSGRASQRVKGSPPMTADALREAEAAFRKEEAANEAAGVVYSGESRPDLKTHILLRRPKQCRRDSAEYTASFRAYALFRRRTVGNTKRHRPGRKAKKRAAAASDEEDDEEEEEEEADSSDDAESDAEMDEDDSESDDEAEASDSSSARPSRRHRGNRSKAQQSDEEESASKPSPLAAPKKRKPLESSFVNPLTGVTMNKPSPDGMDPATYRKAYRAWYDLGRTLRIAGFPPRPEDYNKLRKVSATKRATKKRGAKAAGKMASADESAAAAAAPSPSTKAPRQSSFGPPGGASLHAPSTPASAAAAVPSSKQQVQRRQAPKIAVEETAAAAEPSAMTDEGDDAHAALQAPAYSDDGAAARSPLPPPYLHAAADSPAAAAAATPVAAVNHKRKAGANDDAASSQAAGGAGLSLEAASEPFSPASGAPSKKAKHDAPATAASAANPAARIAAAAAGAAAAAAAAAAASFAEDTMHDERKEEMPPMGLLNGAGAFAPQLAPAAAAAAAPVPAAVPAVAAAAAAPGAAGAAAVDTLESILLRVFRGDVAASSDTLLRFQLEDISLADLECDALFGDYFPPVGASSALREPGFLQIGQYVKLKKEIEQRRENRAA